MYWPPFLSFVFHKMTLQTLLILPLIMLCLDKLHCFRHLEEAPTLVSLDKASLHGMRPYPRYNDLEGEKMRVTYEDNSFISKRLYEYSEKVVNIDDYGAKGDGTSYDSEAFQKAWKEVCSSSTSAILMIPKNKNYLLKTVTFTGPCKSHVSVIIMGTLKASMDRGDWNGKNPGHWILFSDIQNLTVQGGGTINGNGKIWWTNSCKTNASSPCMDAPTALTFNSCKNLRVENLKIRDGQKMHISFEKCTDVNAFNLSITAPGESPNTDGIHITQTEGIEISNCVIRTGDDCISIVSGSRNVMAKNIICGPGHGISIGSLGAHNSEARVSDVTVDTAQFSGTTNGVRIKTWQGGSGYARNITFRNIAMQNVQNPVIIDQNYCDSKEPCHEQKSAVEVREVLYKNIKGTSASEVAINFKCSKSAPCQNILLQNIDLVGAHGDSTKSYCEHVGLSKRGTVVPLVTTAKQEMAN